MPEGVPVGSLARAVTDKVKRELTIPRLVPATVLSFADGEAMVHVDGDPPDRFIPAECLVPEPWSGDRVLLIFGDDVCYVLAFIGAPPWREFTPVWGGVTLGTGATSIGRYKLLDAKTVVFHAQFILGVGGNVTGTITLDGPSHLVLPSYAQPGVAWAGDSNVSQRYAGSFTSGTGSARWVSRIGGASTAGGTVQRAYSTLGFDADDPFDWTDNDQLLVGAQLELA